MSLSRLAPIVALALVLSFGGATCGSDEPDEPAKPPPAPARPPDTVPHQAGVELDGGLVTVSIGERCVECHEEIVEAYASSGMHDSLTLPTGAGSVEARMVGREVVDPETGITGRFEAGDGHYLIRMLYRDPAGVERASYSMRIDLVIGSGHSTRTYLQSKDGFLFELPLTWYSQLDDLALSPGPGFRQLMMREAQNLCVACHTGLVESKDPLTLTGYRGEISLGIGCVRCHGDAEEHCDTGDPEHVVNPARMSDERQADVCNQCHLSGALDLLKRGVSIAEYTPGDPLGLIHGVFEPKDGGGESGTSIAGHGKRMRKSRCFTESDGMTCTTCHNPHRGHKAKETAADTFSGCFVCHKQDDCHEDVGVRGDRTCVACHMSRQASNDIAHTTTTDHFIRVRPQDSALSSLTPEERSIAGQAVRDEELVNVLDPEDAYPRSRLLKARAYVQGVELARQMFGRNATGYLRRSQDIVEGVLAETPDDEEALVLKTRLLNMAGKDLAALSLAERLLERFPNSGGAVERRAFAAYSIGRFDDARGVAPPPTCPTGPRARSPPGPWPPKRPGRGLAGRPDERLRPRPSRALPAALAGSQCSAGARPGRVQRPSAPGRRCHGARRASRIRRARLEWCAARRPPRRALPAACQPARRAR